LKDIEKKHPDIELETSIMVGFPSETDNDFEKSITLLNNGIFDRIVVYEYDERPNLPSLKIETPVPQAIKNRRYIQMSNYATLCEIKKWVRKGNFFSLATLDVLLKIALMGVRALARKTFSLDAMSLNIQS